MVHQLDSLEVEIPSQVAIYFRKVKCFFGLYILLTMTITVLRAIITDLKPTPLNKTLVICYIPCILVCYSVACFMIAYFFKTAIGFVRVLESVNMNRARVLIGSVSMVLVLGEFRKHVVETLIVVDAIFF